MKMTSNKNLKTALYNPQDEQLKNWCKLLNETSIDNPEEDVACLTRFENDTLLSSFTSASAWGNNKKRYYFQDVMSIAARYGRLEFAMSLFKKDQSLFTLSYMNEVNIGGPIHCAAFGGHIDFAKWLVEKIGPEVLGVKDSRGTLPIHTAALAGNIAFAKWLVDDMGQDISAKDVYHNMPVNFAACYNQLDFAKWLDRRGQDFKGSGKWPNGSPLRAAIEMGNIDVVRWLLVDKKCNFEGDDIDETPIEYAITCGRYDLYQWFVNNLEYSKGGRAHYKYFDGGMTPLHIAARMGDLEFIKALNPKEDELKVMDNQGWMPIHHAFDQWWVNKLSEEVMRYFLDRQEVNQLTGDGKTFLHMSHDGLFSSSEVARMVVEEYGGEHLIYQRCSNGLLPIHYAIDRSDDLLLELCVNKMFSISQDLEKKDFPKIKLEDLDKIAVVKGSYHIYPVIRDSELICNLYRGNYPCGEFNRHNSPRYDWLRYFVDKIYEHYKLWSAKMMASSRFFAGGESKHNDSIFSHRKEKEDRKSLMQGGLGKINAQGENNTSVEAKVTDGLRGSF